jgi:RND family efflux transporter MFP subunit
MSNQLLQMKTQLLLAKTTFERQERLWNQQIGSEIQYLQAKTNYESQQSAVDQLESQLDKFNMKAPFSGIIDDVIKDQGTVVVPGGPGSEVFRIINLSEMYLEVNVPETYIATITKGKAVKVYFPVLNTSVESNVRQTGNFINPNNRSFTVEIPVSNQNGQIKPNMSAKVLINDYLNEEAILIPQSIISENAEGEQYAFVVSNIDDNLIAQANKNIITTGKTQGDFVEVLTGIDNGDSIIEEGARSVKDGQKVKILTNN